MEFQDVLKRRRSIKAFDPDHEMSDEELRHLLGLAALAPTSFNMQNWHFVAVKDPARRAELEAAAFGQRQVGSASVVVVVAGDLKAQENTARTLRALPGEVRTKLAKMIGDFYSGNDALVRDEACRSAGIAGMTLMLAAVDMGYMSCPMIGYDPTRVSAALGLPETHPPLLMIPIGRPATEVRPRMGLLDFEELVSVDRFGHHPFTGPIPE